MADDDVAAERARLETLAWGGAAPEDEAAAARLALQELGRRPRRSPSAAAHRPGGTPPVTPQAASTTRSAPTPRPAGSESAAVGSVAVGSPAAGSVTAGAVTAGSAARAGSAAPWPAGPDEFDDDGGADPARTDHVDDGTVSDGDDPRLQAGAPSWRTRAARILWTTRPRVWIALGAAAAVGVAFAAGTVVGTAHQESASAPSVTPTAGAVTLEELLDKPQTYADQLPGPVEASVSLHTTRLIFTNRALDGGSFRTPWGVWAAVGTDRSTICLVATANRIESTSACYPREDALHGSVSLSAQSMSGTLTLTLRGGAVQGTVTNEQ
ncbi:hypothetical protein DEJ28_09265 [Curtobacterium sp. MCPF17_002]|uniref:hypothetical protein n=1 Tax=Curtobacterium sp. MCPF17_002 TaxID=2175645 RepID=UPI000DA932C1|nr:hypothetical protein [Curtobacterium sp. MCPF17_002]WIB75885.1 hypothetical protein DEJ28_09265 [Curtobacterium sp. MCPF17_002]